MNIRKLFHSIRDRVYTLRCQNSKSKKDTYYKNYHKGRKIENWGHAYGMDEISHLKVYQMQSILTIQWLLP